MDRVSLSEQFQECLECSVCDSFFAKPIFICSNGHSICGSCRDLNCAVCKEQLFRNISLEQVLAHVSKKCKHSGCSEVIPIVEYQKHYEECVFNQAVSCIECPSKQADIVSHLVLKHDYKEILHESGTFRSFSGPSNFWEKDINWPKGIWKIDQEPIIVIAKCHKGVFYIDLFKVSKEPVIVKLKVQSRESYLTFKGPVPLIGTQSLAIFNCEVRSLIGEFAEKSNDDIIKLFVKVSKI